MTLESSLQTASLAAFGTKGTFWRNVGNQIESLFQETVRIDPSDGTSADPLDATKKATVLFFSVPDENISGIIDTVHSALRGKIVLENSSTKNLGELQRIRDAGAEVCSLHTLVSTASPHAGESIVISPLDALCQNAKMVAEEIANVLSMHPVFMLPKEHRPKVNEKQSDAHLIARLHALVTAMHLQEHGFSMADFDGCTTASQTLLDIATHRILALDGIVSARFLVEIPKTITRTRSALDRIEAALKISSIDLARLFDENALELGVDKNRKKEIQDDTNLLLRIIKLFRRNT